MKLESRDDIFAYCSKQLEELYPAGVPKEATDRLDMEMKEHMSICGEETVDRLILFHEISEAAHRMAMKINVAGAVSNSIFTYLLGDHEMNPLPAHYYCEHCGHFETGFDVTSGMDLKTKWCPECGKRLRQDGFTLSHRFAWGEENRLHFEYRVPTDFYHVAVRTVERHYLLKKPYPLGYPAGERVRYYEEHGVAFLPEGEKKRRFSWEHELDDYPELTGYLRDGETQCIVAKMDKLRENGVNYVPIHTSRLLDDLNVLQKRVGMFIDDIKPEEYSSQSLRDVLNTGILSENEDEVLRYFRPKSFSDAANLILAAHNTIADGEHEQKIVGLEAVKKLADAIYPTFSCEDVYEYLLDQYGDERKAYETARYIQMGQCQKIQSPEELSEEFLEYVKQIGYLFPRAFGVWFLIQYKRFSFYFRRDQKAFAEVMWEKD